MDIGIFENLVSQIGVLAFPGVVVASLLTGALIQAIFPYWAFKPCWLLGTILSATDPVAVVALLKDLGAPKVLNTLIEGESLLNDGSSVVIFEFLMLLIRYDDVPPVTEGPYLELARIVAQMVFLGVLLGVLMGSAVVWCLRRVYNDVFVEVAVVVGSSYLLFWLAEVMTRASAVLAVVVFGIYMNRHRECISVEVAHFLHEFYEMAAYMLNTAIFLIAGVRLGTAFVEYPPSPLVLLIYPGVVLVRALTVALFYPLLSRVGNPPLNPKTAAVCVWGGLRGSVGLALALVVEHTTYDHSMWDGELSVDTGSAPLLCRDVPRNTLVITCYIVLATVVVNGSTVAKLMEVLGLDRLPDDRQFMLKQASHKLDAETVVYMGALRAEAFMESTNWRQVRSLLYHGRYTYQTSNSERAAWQQALNMERSAYLEMYEAGELSERAASRLLLMMGALLADSTADSATEREALYERAALDLITSFVVSRRLGRLEVSRLALLRRWAHGRVFDQLSLAFEVGKAYVSAHDKMMRELSKHAAARGAAAELVRAVRKVVQERASYKERILEQMTRMTHELPSISQAVETRYAANLVLRKQRSIVERMQHHGELTDLDAASLIAGINHHLKDLYRIRPRNLGAADDSTDLVEAPSFRFLEGAVEVLRTDGGAAASVESGAESGAESSVESQQEQLKMLNTLLSKRTLCALPSYDELYEAGKVPRDALVIVKSGLLMLEHDTGGDVLGLDDEHGLPPRQPSKGEAHASRDSAARSSKRDRERDEEESAPLQLGIMPNVPLQLSVTPSTTRGAGTYSAVGPAESLELLRGLLASAAPADSARGVHGKISPISMITLSDENRAKASIPIDAKYYAYFYPPSDVPMDSVMDHLSSSPWLFFTMLGGFGYMDAAYRLIALNALTLLPSEASLTLAGPFEADTPFVGALQASGRMHTGVLDSLARARVQSYGYVQPGELVSGSLSLSSTELYDHGAFVYSLGGSAPVFYAIADVDDAGDDLQARVLHTPGARAIDRGMRRTYGRLRRKAARATNGAPNAVKEPSSSGAAAGAGVALGGGSMLGPHSCYGIARVLMGRDGGSEVLNGPSPASLLVLPGESVRAAVGSGEGRLHQTLADQLWCMLGREDALRILQHTAMYRLWGTRELFEHVERAVLHEFSGAAEHTLDLATPAIVISGECCPLSTTAGDDSSRLVWRQAPLLCLPGRRLAIRPAAEGRAGSVPKASVPRLVVMPPPREQDAADWAVRMLSELGSKRCVHLSGAGELFAGSRPTAAVVKAAIKFKNIGTAFRSATRSGTHSTGRAATRGARDGRPASIRRAVKL